MRKLKLTKNKMEKAVEAFKEIVEHLGIVVVDIERDGDTFEFTFDRDLTKEETGKLTAIKAILQAKFPDHKIIEVEEDDIGGERRD